MALLSTVDIPNLFAFLNFCFSLYRLPRLVKSFSAASSKRTRNEIYKPQLPHTVITQNQIKVQT